MRTCLDGWQRMVEDWLLLSDRGAVADPATTLVEAGMFVVELDLPVAEAAVLLDFHSSAGWPRTFTLFHDPQAGLVLIHRQGQSVQRHALPGPMPQQSCTGRLSLRFDAPARHWEMRLEFLGCPDLAPLRSTGQNPLPILLEDLDQLSHGPARARRHGAVLWFGLTKGADLPARAPWVGQRTPVETARGTVLAGHLQPGDLVATADGGLLPLRRITRLDLPACGSFAPIILRAPFFGASQDMLVAADQRLALSGPEVEYLFGEERVLVAAGAMVDGQSALAEQRRAVASVLMLEFDHPALILADGCPLFMDRADRPPSMRVLEPYEVLTLMAMLGRASHRRVA